jgi:hypothetical protein
MLQIYTFLDLTPTLTIVLLIDEHYSQYSEDTYSVTGLAGREDLMYCYWCLPHPPMYCAHSIIFHDQTNACRLPTQTTNQLLMLENQSRKLIVIHLEFPSNPLSQHSVARTALPRTHPNPLQPHHFHTRL